jgi:D-aminoacyl-tRNA deacylase
MRAVIQRVERASVLINNSITRKINKGLVILVGFEDSDNNEDIDWLTGKIIRLRIFDDENGIMNKSVDEINGEIMVVSQFTLHASTKKGNRPSYIRASKPDIAIPMYELFLKSIKENFKNNLITGEFGANMKIDLLNDGPVTILIDTKNKE